MRTFASPGAMTVDWEERVNPDRLRTYRFGRAKAALAASDLGAVLLFDFNNIRYVTSTHIGEWARDKMTRYALQTRGGEPAHLGLRVGGQAPPAQLPVAAPRRTSTPGWSACAARSRPTPACSARAAREICEILRAEGVADMPLGVDIVEPPMLAALEAEGITVRDGQQVMLDAREVKSIDEIMLLNTACSMVDGAYQLLSEQLKPGVRESELVANVTQVPVRPRARSTSTTSTRSPASAAARIRTCSATGSSAPATRPSSTSSTRSSATRPATTGRSWSARRATPSATPTSGRASGSTPRSS